MQEGHAKDAPGSPGIDAHYADLIWRIFHAGDRIQTRNATCYRLFGEKFVFTSTPLVSLRKTAWKSALREMEWFLSGSNLLKDLHPSVRPWWEPWADEHGAVYFNYSEQFRHSHGGRLGRDELISVDQLDYLIAGIHKHPYSRRNVITTWNTAEMVSENCPITNCHGTIIQAFVRPDSTLHLVTYQRSADVICGLPHNWIQYWALLLWLASRTGRDVGSLQWIGGDVHIYEEHGPLARKLLETTIGVSDRAELLYNPSSLEFKADDFSVTNYSPIICETAKMIV